MFNESKINVANVGMEFDFYIGMCNFLVEQFKFNFCLIFLKRDKTIIIGHRENFFVK